MILYTDRRLDRRTNCDLLSQYITMRLYAISIVLLLLYTEASALLRLSNVTECVECGCLNIDPTAFESVNYVNGYNDAQVQTNKTIFLITQNWYIAVHDIQPDYDNLTVCFSVTYTFQGSFQPLVDGMWVCMDLDTPYYDVEHRTIIDPDQSTSNIETGTIFVLYNPSRINPLVLGCTGCEMSDQDYYDCSVRECRSSQLFFLLPIHFFLR